MDHVTQAKRKLKDLIENQLPGLLQAADLEAADGVTTPPPFRIHTTDKNQLDGYPAIELHATGSAPQVDSTAQVYRHRVVAGVTLAGDDEERLAVQVERYIYCLRQMARNTLLAPEVPTGPIDTGVEEYTPITTPPAGMEEPFVKGAFIELLITTVE